MSAAEQAERGVAVVGYGLAGEAFHAPLIAATPGLALRAVVTSDAERGARARSRYPGVSVLERADALWSRGPEAAGVDVVVLATPNRTHVPLGLAALEAGYAVVVDKPLAASVEAGERLVRSAAERGLLLTVFQNRRWDGDFLTLRRLLEEGALGEVVRFESRFERWRPTPKPGWRQRGEAGEAGGLLFDLGSHLIDQALVAFGPVREVYAELDRRRPGAEVDDDTFVALTHASGTRSHLWLSAVAAQSGPRMRVLGTRAGWTKHGLDVQEAALRAGRAADGSAWGREDESMWGVLGTDAAGERVPTEPGDYRRFYALLEAALRTGGEPPVDPRDAVAVLRLIEAARASARGRATVRTSS
jgi:predicted dehydrogenase